MLVSLYAMTKKRNSTMIPSPLNIPTNVDMQIKAPCNIREPLLEGATYYTQNYCYIATWGRYYFINDKTYINGAWTYQLECDLLATYRVDIMTTNMFYTRASSRFNGNLVDKMYPFLGTTQTAEEEFGDLATFDQGYFVISLIGDNASGGGQVLYQMTPAMFQTLLNDLFVYADTGVAWDTLPQGVRLSVMNPTQYITSCRWFPKPFEVKLDEFDQPIATPVKAGMWSSPNARVNIVATGNYTTREFYSVSIPKHNQVPTLGANMNLSPATRYVLELGCFGVTDLDCTLLYDCNTLDIYIYADPFTGIGKARIMGRYSSDPLKWKLVASLDGQYGVNIPIAQGGGFDAGAFTGGTLASHMGQFFNMTITGLSTKASGGSTEEVRSAMLGSADESMNGVRYASSSVGQLLVHNLKKHLYAYFQQKVVGDNTNNGRPLWEYTNASSLASGFMQVYKGVIPINVTSSAEENRDLNRLLEIGFFYE